MIPSKFALSASVRTRLFLCREVGSLKIKADLFDEDKIKRTIKRMSYQIIEKNHGIDKICLLGIKTRGVPLAKRIAENIEEIEALRLKWASSISPFTATICPSHRILLG